jgi:hypothetical protein
MLMGIRDARACGARKEGESAGKIAAIPAKNSPRKGLQARYEASSFSPEN